jgi:hypothetical protein
MQMPGCREKENAPAINMPIQLYPSISDEYINLMGSLFVNEKPGIKLSCFFGGSPCFGKQ